MRSVPFDDVSLARLAARATERPSTDIGPADAGQPDAAGGDGAAGKRSGGGAHKDASSVYRGVAGLTGTNGDDILYGGSGDDTIEGLGGNDTLYGEGGDDILIGGAGADAMVGGTGNDTYHVDDAGDTVTENSGEGADTVVTVLAGYTLPAHVENLLYAGESSFTGAGNALGNVIGGGTGDDDLSGGDGADWFDASGGNDVVEGGDGFDTMRYAGSVRSFEIGEDNGALTLADFVGEEGGVTLTGVEAVYFGAEDETFTLAELLDPSFTGTGGNDTMLAGNTLDNQIYGLAGDDVLRGAAGYDLLDGGDGADTAYYAGSSSDFLIFRTVAGSVWIDDLAGGEHSDELVDIEALYFAGDDVTILVGDLPPLGTSAGETITGTARADALLGLGGDDLLAGLAGDDGLEGGTGDDRYVYDPGDGDDTVWDDGGVDAIEFGAGIDPADVIVTGDGDNYILSFAEAAGSVTILNGVLEDYAVEEVRFDDETVWTAEDLYDMAFGQSLMAPPSGGGEYQGGARAEIFGSWQPYDHGMSCQIV